MAKFGNVELDWLGHDSFRIKSDKVIYIDPWKMGKAEKADLILVTHEHYDHFSSRDIEALSKPTTVVIATQDIASKIKGNVRAVRPGDSFEIDGVKIEAVPAYNTNKSFHPKLNNWVGYVITVKGSRIYHTGDTDRIPEMGKLKSIDIALLPVSGVYVMNCEEAAQAAQTIKPRIAVPMHYGDIVGSRDDALRFKELAKGIDVRIMEKAK